jgi:biopolymer transport protein ExbD
VIVMPRRSVTRFFIPLIDVLILLFCIFLLMPFVSGQPTADTNPDSKTAQDKPLPEDVKTLQTMLAEEKMRVARLEKERLSKLTDRLAVCVMEIDSRDGTLIYFDPDRQEIKTEADAVRAIARQKALASRGGMVKDVFFQILPPRTSSAFPTVAQIEQYRRWFKDVPYGGLDTQ